MLHYNGKCPMQHYNDTCIMLHYIWLMSNATLQWHMYHVTLNMAHVQCNITMAHVSCYMAHLQCNITMARVSTSCLSHLGLIWLCYVACFHLIFRHRMFCLGGRRSSNSCFPRVPSGFSGLASAPPDRLTYSDMVKPTVRIARHDRLISMLNQNLNYLSLCSFIFQ